MFKSQVPRIGGSTSHRESYRMNEVERATEVPEKLEKNTHSSFEKRSFNLKYN